MFCRSHRLAVTVVVGVVTALVLAQRPARAQSVQLNPSCGADCPGSGLLQKLLNWGGQYGLWLSLGAFIAGGAMYGWSYFRGQSPGATRGQALALGGAIGAMAIGIAATAINLFYSAANS